MKDVSWTVGTAPDGNQTVHAIGAPQPTLTRGQTATVGLLFEPGDAAYTTLREYLDFAHAVATNVGLDGTPFYRELHSDTHDLLMSFEPTGVDHPAPVTGWWGVLVGGKDPSGLPDDDPRLEFEMFILAEFGDHASRSAAETAHEV